MLAAAAANVFHTACHPLRGPVRSYDCGATVSRHQTFGRKQRDREVRQTSVMSSKPRSRVFAPHCEGEAPTQAGLATAEE